MLVAWGEARGHLVASSPFARAEEGDSSSSSIQPTHQHEGRRPLSSLATSFGGRTATAATATAQRRAISSSAGAGASGSGSGSSDPPPLNLHAELAALNRELADVFGEPVPDGPAGGAGPASFASGSSSSFAPPPPPPPPPPATPTPSAAADARLSHVEPRTGRASMVDVSSKHLTLREARASCLVRLSRRAASAVAANSLKKGDVLGTARLAGVMAAKKTSDLIPLCHPLLLSRADVTAELVGMTDSIEKDREEDDEDDDEDDEDAASSSSPAAVRIACVARVGGGATGVEMEALTGAAVAALTVYDMVKAVGKGAAVVTDLRLDYKVGGKSGAWARRGFEEEDARGAALLRAAAAEAAEAEGRGGGSG